MKTKLFCIFLASLSILYADARSRLREEFRYDPKAKEKPGSSDIYVLEPFIVWGKTLVIPERAIIQLERHLKDGPPDRRAEMQRFSIVPDQPPSFSVPGSREHAAARGKESYLDYEDSAEKYFPGIGHVTAQVRSAVSWKVGERWRIKIKPAFNKFRFEVNHKF